MRKYELSSRMKTARYDTVRSYMQLLTEHLDGRTVPIWPQHSMARKYTVQLENDGYLRFSADKRGSVITDLGRRLLSELLGDAAESLLMAHLAEIDELAYKCSLLVTPQGTAHYGPIEEESDDGPAVETVACGLCDEVGDSERQALPEERAPPL